MNRTTPCRPEAYRRSESKEFFQGHFSWREVGLFCFVYLVSISNGVVLAVALVILLGWSLTGVAQAMIALSISAIIRFTHPSLAATAPFESVLFWLIAMSAAVSLYARARLFSGPYFFLLVFTVIAVLTSFMVSPNVDVSIMKALSFFIVTSALVAAAGSLRPSEIDLLQRWFFSLALSVALLSLLTLPFPGIAFQTRAGFQGLFSHPQLMGVFFAPFAAYFIVQIFLERTGVLPWWVFGVAVFFAALITASGARTAMLATFLAVAMTLVVVLARGAAFRQTRNPQQIIGFAILMLLLSLSVIVFGGLRDELEALAFKGDGLSVDEAFQASRGAMASAHIENFLDAPLTGHGFGIYRGGVLGGEAKIKRFLGIPISASAEKGVAFTAVLEEVGLIGGLVFYALVVALVATAAKSREPGIVAMALAAILVNFGQAIIFSIGGMGLFMWLLLAFSLSKAQNPWTANPIGQKASATGRPHRVGKGVNSALKRH